MHARFYNSSAGRFLSVDPAGFDPTRPQSWNRYSYVHNNPVNATDPTGRTVEIAASSDVTRVKAYLAAMAMRPDGRASLMRIAGDSGFKLRIDSGTLTSPAKIAIDMKTKGQSAVTFGQTAPTGAVQLAPSGVGTFVANGAKMTLDTNAIGKMHPDKSGVTTTGHEFAHTKDIQAGLVGTALQAGDQPTSATGPAEAEGKRIAAQQPDMSRNDAERLIDLLVPVRP